MLPEVRNGLSFYVLVGEGTLKFIHVKGAGTEKKTRSLLDYTYIQQIFLKKITFHFSLAEKTAQT